MSTTFTIVHLTHQQIDKKKWDACIEKAPNGLIYAYSYYLDEMSIHWDALILNDYEIVMPLTWNKKWGIAYLYQPFLAAQLGLFGKNISGQHVEAFIKAIPPSFKYIDISLNSSSLPPGENWPGSLRSNYILNLQKSYDYIWGHYSDNIQRNIKKALQQGCTIKKEIEAEKIILLAIQQMKEQGQEEKDNINRFRKLYQELHARDMTKTYGVYSAQGELLSSCIFFLSHRRSYYILVGNDPASKSTGASHALIDAFIKDHAGREMVLDFEGSDIPGLALYYSAFGGKQEKYFSLKWNRLPFFLRWLKK